MIIADGVRPDVLARYIDGGRLPALASLREEGSLSTVTSAFPSVTGPAYAPFLMGRYPGAVGLPGLRWYDRSGRIAGITGHSRSYVGSQMRFVDRDIDPASPTLFELAKPSFGALSVIGRGLRRQNRIGRSLAFVARAAATHFRGNVRGWLAIDRRVGEEAAHRLRTKRARYAFVALTGIDKTSHAEGQSAAIVGDALRIVDDTVAFFETYPDFRQILRHVRESEAIIASVLTEHAAERNVFPATLILMTNVLEEGQRIGEIREGSPGALIHLYMTLVNEYVYLAGSANPGLGSLTIEQFHALVDGALRRPT